MRRLGAEEAVPIIRLDLTQDPRWAVDDSKFAISATNNHCNPLGCDIVANVLHLELAKLGLVHY